MSSKTLSGSLFPAKMAIAALCLFCATPALAAEASPKNVSHQNRKWILTWSDDFNSDDGSQPDPAKWRYDLGGSGWGNRELESYTSRPRNVQIRNHNLVIAAIKERSTGSDGIAREFTSGRINTKGLFSQKYGRFEALIKLPAGRGLWPAFWMMGDDIGSVGWPACGEIDIMELIGSAPAIVHGSLHGPNGKPDSLVKSSYKLRRGLLTDDFHLYAVEWEPGEIRFYVDDKLYARRTPSDMPPGAWVFDRQPMFLILNLAVGGTWPGDPDATAFPQQMLVGYVRVYRRE